MYSRQGTVFINTVTQTEEIHHANSLRRLEWLQEHQIKPTFQQRFWDRKRVSSSGRNDSHEHNCFHWKKSEYKKQKFPEWREKERNPSHLSNLETKDTENVNSVKDLLWQTRWELPHNLASWAHAACPCQTTCSSGSEPPQMRKTQPIQNMVSEHNCI